MIDADALVARDPAVVYRDLTEEEGGILLHLESGQYHGLNRTGALIWHLMDGEAIVSDLLSRLRILLPDGPPHLVDDVIAFLHALYERRLIRITPRQGSLR